MEYNGIANIKALLFMAELDGKVDKEVKASIEEQLNILLDYMKQLKVEDTKMWHEIVKEHYDRVKKS